MKSFSYVLQDAEGIHARPAGELVKLAKTFSSKVVIAKGAKSGDCRKIFAVMGLGARQGDEVNFSVEGEDEEAAAAAIEEFMKANL